jgi:hypothetical protein
MPSISMTESNSIFMAQFELACSNELVGDEYEYLSLMKFDLFGNKLD